CRTRSVVIPARRAAAAPSEEAPPTRGESAAARPFLKWAGGKGQLLEPLLARSPQHIETYYEPFLGGGAVFFALLAQPDLAPRRAVLNDLNEDLVTVYRTVRDDVDALVSALAGLSEVYLAAGASER